MPNSTDVGKKQEQAIVRHARANGFPGAEDGEAIRQMLGIDGTAGDAQDVPHPFIPASPGGSCAACGLARAYRKHTGDWEEE